MISTFMRSNLVRLQPKQITYRNFKTFNESLFLADVQNIDFNCHSDNADVIYDSLADNFRKIVDKQHLNKITEGGVMENEMFWQTIVYVYVCVFRQMKMYIVK